MIGKKTRQIEKLNHQPIVDKTNKRKNEQQNKL